MHARYDAAQRTEDNARAWSLVDGLSADAAASPDVRKILRERHRYEFANNPVMNGAVRTVAHDMIGTRPHLKVLSKDKEANREVQKKFVAWADKVGFARKLRLMCRAQILDGESFAILGTNKALSTPVKLDIMPIEAEMVASTLGSLFDASEVDGVILDEQNNPIAYRVLRQHPGAIDGAGVFGASDVLPATDVIHLFRVDRAGQHRGIPFLTPSLTMQHQLRRFMQATLDGAETQAKFPMFFESDLPAEEEDVASVRPLDTFDIERNMIMTLPSGMKVRQQDVTFPPTGLREFHDVNTTDQMRPILMPKNIASGDSSSYNYASGRLDQQTYFKAIEVDRADCELMATDRIFEAWYREARLIDGYLPASIVDLGEDLDWNWYYDGREHVDEGKNATAGETRIKTGTDHRARILAKQGRDIDEEDEIAAASYNVTVEEYRRRLFETTFPAVAKSNSATPRSDDGESEDEEEDSPPQRRNGANGHNGHGHRLNGRNRFEVLNQ